MEAADAACDRYEHCRAMAGGRPCRPGDGHSSTRTSTPLSTARRFPDTGSARDDRSGQPCDARARRPSSLTGMRELAASPPPAGSPLSRRLRQEAVGIAASVMGDVPPEVSRAGAHRLDPVVRHGELRAVRTFRQRHRRQGGILRPGDPSRALGFPPMDSVTEGPGTDPRPTRSTCSAWSPAAVRAGKNCIAQSRSPHVVAAKKEGQNHHGTRSSMSRSADGSSNAVRFTPDRQCLTFEGETWTYATMLRRIDETAPALRHGGVRHGDRVAFLGLNHPGVLRNHVRRRPPRSHLRAARTSASRPRS